MSSDSEVARQASCIHPYSSHEFYIDAVEESRTPELVANSAQQTADSILCAFFFRDIGAKHAWPNVHPWPWHNVSRKPFRTSDRGLVNVSARGLCANRAGAVAHDAPAWLISAKQRSVWHCLLNFRP